MISNVREHGGEREGRCNLRDAAKQLWDTESGPIKTLKGEVWKERENQAKEDCRGGGF